MRTLNQYNVDYADAFSGEVVDFKDMFWEKQKKTRIGRSPK